jgi:NADPH-dependent 2,4-dienoyl-CoA reductase/sulfur reductase-like enzyme
MIRIETPLTEETVERLRAGDRVLISGVLYTARDKDRPMKQLVIIGEGPASISASIYAARKKMDFVLITKGAKALLSIYHDLTYGVSSWI